MVTSHSFLHKLDKVLIMVFCQFHHAFRVASGIHTTCMMAAQLFLDKLHFKPVVQLLKSNSCVRAISRCRRTSGGYHLLTQVSHGIEQCAQHWSELIQLHHEVVGGDKLVVPVSIHFSTQPREKLVFSICSCNGKYCAV